MRGLRAIQACAGLALLAAGACSDAENRARAPGIGAGDGGHEPNEPAPGARDAGGDGGHSVSVGGMELCVYDDEDIYELEAHAAQRGLSSATNGQGFALLHHAADGALAIEAIAVGGAARPTVRLVAAADAPGRALLATYRGAFAMAWMDGEALSLRSLERGAETLVLSRAVVAAEGGAPLFAFIGTVDGYLAAYAERLDAREGGEVVARIQPLDGAAVPDGDPITVALPEGSEPGDLELSKLDAGFLLAFSEPDPENEGRARVVGLPLSAAFEGSGEPVVLSRTPVDLLDFALDARAQSAGVIYQGLEGGVRPTVRLQRVEPDGRTTQDSLNIAAAPRRAADGSIAAFGQGYAVAYRAQTSLGMETAAIRIAFVNQFGVVVHDALLADTTDELGPTRVSSTPDGKLLVAWVSVEGASAVTRAIQLDCPGALSLCGGRVD